MVKDAPKKKCSFNLGIFHKGGGGSEPIQKFWDTFCAQNFLDLGLEKGEGLIKSESFRHFSP